MTALIPTPEKNYGSLVSHAAINFIPSFTPVRPVHRSAALGTGDDGGHHHTLSSGSTGSPHSGQRSSRESSANRHSELRPFQSHSGQ